MHIPLRRGMLVRHQNHVYQVTDFSERHTGKQKPTVHVALRDIRDGHPVDRTLDALLPIEEVPQTIRKMQYLYSRGDARIFMDVETFEELELSGAQLGDRPEFLKEGEEYRVHVVDGRPVLVEVPDIVALRVEMTAAPGHSIGGGSNITKEARLENGMDVRVPLFIRTGDVIRIDTRTRTYVGKNNA